MEGLKLIIEKGQRQGETLQYTSRSVVKIGRVARGNTVAIKDDAGISSKHISIKFDTHLNKWTLSDLDSSNGTVLNGKTLNPNVDYGLNDNDCIKIGEFTSIVVKIGVESSVRSDGSCEFGGGIGSDELGLGFGEKIGGNGVGGRNLRSRVKKGVSFKNDLVSVIPVGKRVTEDLNVDVKETVNVVNVSGAVEPRMTRGMKRNLSVQKLTECLDIDERKLVDVDVKDGKRARRGRKVNVVILEANSDNADESVQVDDGNEIGMDPSENVESCNLKESLKTEKGSVQDGLVKDFGQWVDLKTKNGKRVRGGRKVVTLEGDLDGSDKSVQVDDGNELGMDRSENVESCSLEESLKTKNGSVQDGLVKDFGQWVDLEKMTLGDLFDYMEMQLPKEIRDKSDKVVADLLDMALKCHEFRLQTNKDGMGLCVN